MMPECIFNVFLKNYIPICIMTGEGFVNIKKYIRSRDGYKNGFL